MPCAMNHPRGRARPGAEPAARDGVGTDRLGAWCEQYYGQVQERVHRLLANDVRRGRPWLLAMLSTGDIVHEVFLGVVRDFGDFRGSSEGEFVAYVSRLVRNRLIDTVRHHQAARRDRRRQVNETVDVLDSRKSPGSQLARADDADLLAQILATLPERDRALLRGRVEDEMPFQDLAEALGYASADSARKAFCAVQAKVLARLQRGQEGQA